MPEIDQELMKAAKKKVKVTFTPHLIPMFRGILSTIYLDVEKNYSAKYIYSYLKKLSGYYLLKRLIHLHTRSFSVILPQP